MCQGSILYVGEGGEGRSTPEDGGGGLVSVTQPFLSRHATLKRLHERLGVVQK